MSARLLWVLFASCAVDSSGATTADGSTEPPDAAVLGDAGALGPDARPAADASAARCLRVRVVTAGPPLNVRGDPSTTNPPVATLLPGVVVTVIDLVSGEIVRDSDLWYEIESARGRGFVSAAFASCTEEPVTPMDPDGFWLPLECGASARISQGNNGGFSHSGRSAYAFDFSLGLGTPLHAMADGVAIYVKGDTGPGDPCYDGGGSECFPHANYVVLLHADGTATAYKHLNEALVEVGASVRRGSAIGLSGSTGYSTGPHAHVVRQEECGGPSCQSIPMTFVDVSGSGVPETGDTVISGNCP